MSPGGAWRMSHLPVTKSPMSADVPSDVWNIFPVSEVLRAIDFARNEPWHCYRELLAQLCSGRHSLSLGNGSLASTRLPDAIDSLLSISCSNKLSQDECQDRCRAEGTAGGATCAQIPGRELAQMCPSHRMSQPLDVSRMLPEFPSSELP